MNSLLKLAQLDFCYQKDSKNDIDEKIKISSMLTYTIWQYYFEVLNMAASFHQLINIKSEN